MDAGIAVFAFNRPEVKNALSRKLVNQVCSIHSSYGLQLVLPVLQAFIANMVCLNGPTNLCTVGSRYSDGET